MDIETVFGVIWRQASIFEITIIFLFISTIIFFLFLLKYNQVLKDRKIHDYQLFLFKLKRLGFSNFQIKIINNIVDILQLKDPNALPKDPELYEKAVGRLQIPLHG